MIAIVVDNTVYITRKEAQFYGVSIAPSVYKVNGNYVKDKYIDELKEDNIYGEFFLSTKQPEVKSFFNIFREEDQQLFLRKITILGISIPSF